MPAPDRIVISAFGCRYVKMAQLCIWSLRRFYDGRVDVITDGWVTEAAVVPSRPLSRPESSAAGLRLPDFLSLDPRETVLYLDADVLVRKPLDLPVLGEKVMVYGYPRRRQKERSFAGAVTKNSQVTRQRAFCAGIFFFHPVPTILDALRAAYTGFRKDLRAKRKRPCWEQHRFCYELCSRNLVDYRLTGLVGEERRGRIPGKALFNHFCGIRKSALPKMQRRMRGVIPKKASGEKNKEGTG